MKVINEIYLLFAGNGLFFLTCMIALLFLAAGKEKERFRQYFLYPCLIVLAVGLNPLVLKFCVESGWIENARWVRVFWTIQLIFAVACMCSILINTGKKYRYLKAGLCLLGVLLVGTPIFGEHNFYANENIYKIPQEAIDIVDVIEGEVQSEHKTMAEVRMVVPENLCSYIKQYNGYVKMPYGRREEINEVAIQLRAELREEVLDADAISSHAEQLQCDFVVVPVEAEQTGSWGSYEYLEEVSGYVIYRFCSDI